MPSRPRRTTIALTAGALAVLLYGVLPLGADDPYGVMRSPLSVIPRLKVTSDREVRQNDSAIFPEDTFRVLAYNLFMLPDDGCALGFDPCRAGSNDKWQLVDDVIAEADAADGGYDVLVLSELWKYGVWQYGLDVDGGQSLMPVMAGWGYDRARQQNNNFGNVQSQLWERGYRWQTKAPGARSQFEEDGGVFIASKWPILDAREFVYPDCNGTALTHVFGGGTSDCSARKGAVWAKIQGSANHVYHVFATHMQASAFNSDGTRHADWPDYVTTRGKQLENLAGYVTDRVNDGSILPDEMVIFAGDFNIIAGDSEESTMLSTLNATRPPTTSRTGRMFTANDQQTNDLAPVLGGAEPAMLLDYVLFGNLNRIPVNPRQVIRPMRTSAAWRNFANGGSFHHDLSDHHAVVGSFAWSFLSNSGSPRVALATSSANTFNGSTWTTTPALSRYAHTKVLAGDFNGDGRTDMVQIETPRPGEAASVQSVRTALSNGSGAFTAGVWANWSARQDYRYLTGDFNGDRKTDLFRIERPAAGTSAWRDFRVGLSNGTSAVGNASWGSNLVSSDDLFLAGDFTGDGRTDVLQVEVPPASAGWVNKNLILARNFSGVGPPAFGDWNAAGSNWSISATDMEMLVGDFNGDGKTDVLKIDLPSSGCSTLGLWVGTTRQDPQTGFFEFQIVGDGPQGQWAQTMNCRNSKYFTGDFNGDGRTDVAWVRFDSGDPEAVAERPVFTALARPSEAAGRWNFNVIRSANTVPASIDTKFLAADFTGDGMTDLLRLTAPDFGRGRSCMAMRMSSAKRNASGTFDAENGNIQNGLGPSPNWCWSSYKQLKMLSGDFNYDGQVDVLFLDVPTM